MSLRSTTKEDLMALGLEDLMALLQRGNAALVTLAEQLQDYKKEFSTMGQEHRTLLALGPRVSECFASGPVKLNVGGTYFSTSVDNLTREPGTFFAVMFSGRWDVKINPKDDAVFVDRDPVMFGMIVNYLRTGEIDLDDLSSSQFRALLNEADFYQIASLLGLLYQSTFSPEIRGDTQLSRGNSFAKSLEGYSYVISLAAFSPSLREMKIRLIKGEQAVIGVAPQLILKEGNTFSNCGWHVYAYDGSLYGQNGESGRPFKRKINKGSVITVKLDKEFNIFFRVDGEDWGIAYRKVAKDYSVPLHLAISLYQPGDAAKML